MYAQLRSLGGVRFASLIQSAAPAFGNSARVSSVEAGSSRLA